MLIQYAYVLYAIPIRILFVYFGRMLHVEVPYIFVGALPCRHRMEVSLSAAQNSIYPNYRPM